MLGEKTKGVMSGEVGDSKVPDGNRLLKGKSMKNRSGKQEEN